MESKYRIGLERFYERYPNYPTYQTIDDEEMLGIGAMVLPVIREDMEELDDDIDSQKSQKL